MSDETKHTKGPWKFYGDSNYGGTVEIGPKVTVSVDRADRFSMELVISREEVEANGRLIAAAPELLVALKRALVRCTNCDTCGPALCPECEVDMAVVAKAEGRS